MRILIAEDDKASRKYITKLMSAYGECDITVDGMGAIEAFVKGLDTEKPYDLICLDVMMPRVDGIKALKTIRALEKLREVGKSQRAKVMLTTALGETQYIMSAFETGLEAYINKPIEINKVEEALMILELI